MGFWLAFADTEPVTQHEITDAKQR
jgi:hypothetical protein